MNRRALPRIEAGLTRTAGTAVLATCLSIISGAQAQVVFEFDFSDAAGTGFNVAGALGEQRRTALERSGRQFASYFRAYDATIQVRVDGSVTGNETLASAGSEFNADGAPGFGNAGDVALKILGGNAADPAPALHDAEISWNFNFDWDLGDNVADDRYDFVSTVVHELAHAVGFSSDISREGTDGFDNEPGADGGFWAPFDQFVGDADGAMIDDEFALDLDRWDAAFEGGTGADGLFFWGDEAVAANGGQAVNLFSPGSWEEGSSGSHLDDDFFSETDLVMEAASDEGPYAREFSDVELAIFRDIGFDQVAAVPLPAAVWLFLCALLTLGGLRRSKAQHRAALSQQERH